MDACGALDIFLGQRAADSFDHAELERRLRPMRTEWERLTTAPQASKSRARL